MDHSSLIVDSHQHFWQVGQFDYPWMSPEVGVLCRDHLPPQLEPLLNRSGVRQTVLVQASNSVTETRWLLNLAARYSFIAGVVGWVDLTATNVDEQLREFASDAHFKGVRHLVESEPQDDWLEQPVVLGNLQALAAGGVAYDLLVHPRHLKYAMKVAATCPDLNLVVDHLAKPPIASKELDDWARALKPLAAHRNVWCKLSGLVTEADWANWRTEDLRPYVDKALEYFGPDRLMFGSDWPVCLLAASYEQVLEAAQTLTSELTDDERQKVFAGNATAFYGLAEASRSVPSA